MIIKNDNRKAEILYLNNYDFLLEILKEKGIVNIIYFYLIGKKEINFLCKYLIYLYQVFQQIF